MANKYSVQEIQDLADAVARARPVMISLPANQALMLYAAMRIALASPLVTSVTAGMLITLCKSLEEHFASESAVIERIQESFGHQLRDVPDATRH